MLVHHFDRDNRVGNYTFEQLFETIRKELVKSIQVNVFKKPDELGILKSIQWASKNKGPINHITGDVNYLSLGLPKENTIITVHDIGHYTRSLKGWKKKAYKKLWMDIPFNRVKHITAISEFTKNQLIQYAGVPDSKITVIKNPVLPFIKPSPAPNHEIPVILQIGSGTNKNLERLIHAVRGLDVKLLLINRLENSSHVQLLRDFGIQYEQRINLDSQGLNQAYQDADIVFFASEYEGFGLPILEAQAAQRPVVTGNVSAMPEAAGEGALVVDPFSVDEIRKGLLELIEQAQLRESLIELGQKNLQQYQVQTIAQNYLALYEQI
ncbi:glycosyltransferase family 1 protein [Algoriphagus sp.]|uniref:glycosyltransferase family 4 protein n=1 Tax=Algoriphagus sp. TaxID=1872435 RepID=UPI00260553A8|nr:glycosyltransferase family 1 protein [Algoriphagus sp.]